MTTLELREMAAVLLAHGRELRRAAAAARIRATKLHQHAEAARLSAALARGRLYAIRAGRLSPTLTRRPIRPHPIQESTSPPSYLT